MNWFDLTTLLEITVLGLSVTTLFGLILLLGIYFGKMYVRRVRRKLGLPPDPDL
jgi:hypothetical protein